MNIIGLSCFYHDAAAALVIDGKLVAAAEEERFSRKKHDNGFPINAVNFCLRKGGISAQDVDYVVFYEKPFLKFERIMLSIIAGFPKTCGLFRESMQTWLTQKIWIKGIIKAKLGLPEEKIKFVEHHLCHAASAFFCSPYSESAIMTVDGVGEWTTTAYGYGKSFREGDNAGGSNEITLTSEIKFPHSIGLLYSAFTAFLGFEVNEGEYKVMGMAPITAGPNTSTRFTKPSRWKKTEASPWTCPIFPIITIRKKHTPANSKNFSERPGNLPQGQVRYGPNQSF